MKTLLNGVMLLLSLGALMQARADDEVDMAEAEKLYQSQCRVCHGNVVLNGQRDSEPRWKLARAETNRSTQTDFPSPLISSPAGHGPGPGMERIAIAPPYGPSLRGIHGRTAATVEGFIYSKAFLKAFEGMVWDDATLNVWITDTQRWVPGVFMFYKQKDPEVRRKIIAYLKANP
jgi:cytochrome c2